MSNKPPFQFGLGSLFSLTATIAALAALWRLGFGYVILAIGSLVVLIVAWIEGTVMLLSLIHRLLPSLRKQPHLVRNTMD